MEDLRPLRRDPSVAVRTVTGVVFPPSVDSFFEANVKVNRSPVVIEKIGPMSQTPTKLMQASPVNNIDPRNDQWRIQISTNVIWPDPGTVHGRDINIVELKAASEAQHGNRQVLQRAVAVFRMVVRMRGR